MARLEAKLTNAFLKHLGRAMTSHCPEHKWAAMRELPGKWSIFYPSSVPDEPAEDAINNRMSPSPSQVWDKNPAPQVEPLVDSISSCELNKNKPVEGQDHQGFSGVEPGFPRMDPLEQDQVSDDGQDQIDFPENDPLEGSGTNMGPSVEADQAQEEEEFEEGPLETQATVYGQEASEIPGLVQDSLGDVLKESNPTLKTCCKGGLTCGGKKKRKKQKPGTQGNPSHFGGTPSVHTGVPDLAEGEPAKETKSKGSQNITKPLFRVNNQEEKKPEELGPFFYIGGANGVDILINYCKNKGWQRMYDNRREDYILKWCETKFRDTYYNFKEGEQLLYQIPNNKIITTKIGLLMNLREYDRVMKKVNRTSKMLKMEDFFPETFRLDTKDERENFFEIYKEPQIWICKPTSFNQGRGIFLLKNEAEVNNLQAKLQLLEEDPAYRKVPYKIPPARIVQRYIDKPLLLEGKKFDVRSYLLIVCTMPPHGLHKEHMVFFGHGYARLTCLNYDPKSEDLTSHLTNQYIQKKSPLYSHVKEETVWQMDRFNTYVNERFKQDKGLPKDWVFNGFTKRMKEIMLQCFLTVKSKLDCKLGYFDLIGCDFLIDEDFKVWLLEMNANPALHTNCNALKNIIPTVVNETLDLVIEIFTKSQRAQNIMPLESLCHFALLHNGVASDNAVVWPTKSRTSLRSLRIQRLLPDADVTSAGGPTIASIPVGASIRPTDKKPPKVSEKAPKGEAKGGRPSILEGTTNIPSKGGPQNTLPMPQIQISIIPSLSYCPSVTAAFQNDQTYNSGNQYIIKDMPSNLSERMHKMEVAKDQSKMDSIMAAGGHSKDRSYSSWFQQMFGKKLPVTPVGNRSKGALTSSQMVSLHLQSNLPPSLPRFQDYPKSFRKLTEHAKPPQSDNSKPAAVGRSCGDSLTEDKKISHRSS